MLIPPIPSNEMDRLISLSDLDIDYLTSENSFRDLAKLAARVAGTKLSMVNFIDAYTQWTVSNYGIDIDQMPREESVCQFTIMEEGSFEIKDLRADERFNDMPYVVGEPRLGYYFGVPLKSEGYNIGALCVLNQEMRKLSPEKIELLKIIGDEIVNRLKAFRVIESLKSNLKEAKESQKKVAHDIRGPLGGIVGLAKIISEQGESNQIDEVLEFINLIHKSGNSLLDLADEILGSDKKQVLNSHEFNLMLFKTKLEELYMAQARNKQISFLVNIGSENSQITFSKNKLLQIAGNLISNAIKFTPVNGTVSVDLSLKVDSVIAMLIIKVSDTGPGMNIDTNDAILNGAVISTHGTRGETGYGFGLALVKHLLDKLGGTMSIHSNPGSGTAFEVNIPQ